MSWPVEIVECAKCGKQVGNLGLGPGEYYDIPGSGLWSPQTERENHKTINRRTRLKSFLARQFNKITGERGLDDEGLFSMRATFNGMRVYRASGWCATCDSIRPVIRGLSAAWLQIELAKAKDAVENPVNKTPNFTGLKNRIGKNECTRLARCGKPPELRAKVPEKPKPDFLDILHLENISKLIAWLGNRRTKQKCSDCGAKVPDEMLIQRIKDGEQWFVSNTFHQPCEGPLIIIHDRLRIAWSREIIGYMPELETN